MEKNNFSFIKKNRITLDFLSIAMTKTKLQILVGYHSIAVEKLTPKYSAYVIL